VSKIGNFEKNGSDKKELLERKIGGKKSKIGATLLLAAQIAIQQLGYCCSLLEGSSK